MFPLWLFVVLGCSVPHLLEDRIRYAVLNATELNPLNSTHLNSPELDPPDPSIDWFLSGGIKAGKRAPEPTEADRMEEMIKDFRKLRGHNRTNDTWRFILDRVATNTAENFIMLKHQVDISSYSGVYVVTSEFHHERASRIAEHIIPNNKFHWILSPESLHDSKYWENIHMRNVRSDVMNAKNKLKIS